MYNPFPDGIGKNPFQMKRQQILDAIPRVITKTLEDPSILHLYSTRTMIDKRRNL